MGASWGERTEVACIRPGVWLVEGYNVERITQGDRRGWWEVLHRFTGEPVKHYGNRRTLTEAIELIDDLLIQRSA